MAESEFEAAPNAKFTRLLPPSLQGAVWLEAKTKLELVVEAWENAVRACDVEEGLAHATRQLQGFLELKYPLPSAPLVKLVRLVFAHCTAPLSLPTDQRRKALESLRSLLHKAKRRKQQHDPVVGCLALPWRGLHARMEHCVFEQAGGVHISSLFLRVVRVARHFFEEASVDEMLREWLPGMGPHDMRCVKNLGYLSLFLPTHLCSARTIVPTILPLIDLHPHDPSYHVYCACLLARLAATQDDSNAEEVRGMWEAVLRKAVQMFVAALQAPVGTSQPAPIHLPFMPCHAVFLCDVGDRAVCLGSMLAKLLARTLESTGFAVRILKDLLHQTQTLFHPSNSGRWSVALSHTLHAMIGRVLSRCEDENQGAGVQQREGPVRKRSPKRIMAECIAAEQVDAICEQAKSVCWQCVFCKDQIAMFMSRDALRLVACARPALVVSLVTEQCLPHLENVAHSHLTIGCLEVLGAVLSPLLPYLHAANSDNPGALPSADDVVLEVLKLSLPGLDSNDAPKTLSTLKLLLLLSCTVPLSTTPSSPLPSLSSSLSEFPTTLIHAVWGVLLHAEGKGSSEGGTNGKVAKGIAGMMDEWRERLVRFVLGKGMELWLATMQPDVYKTVLQTLVENIDGEVNSSAMTECGQFVGVVASAFPAISLPVLVPPLLRTEGLPDTHVRWRLTILGCVVGQCGPHIAPFSDDIQAAVWKAWEATNSKKLKHCAGELLKGTLSSLCSFAIASYHPLPPNARSQMPFNPHVSMEECNVEWHVPTESSVALANSILARALETAVARFELSKEGSGKEDGDGKAKARHERRSLVMDCLYILDAAVSAVSTCLGVLDGVEDQVRVCTRPGRNSRAGLPPLRQCGVVCPWPMLPPTTRATILTTVLEVAQHVMANDEGHIKALVLALNVVGSAVGATGGSSETRNMRYLTQQFKAKVSLPRGASLARWAVCARAQQLVRMRLFHRTFTTHTLVEGNGRDDNDGLLGRAVDVLVALCVHPFSSVRMAAQGQLQVPLRALPMRRGLVLSGLLSSLASLPPVTDEDDAHKHTLNGLLHTLYAPSLMKKLTLQPKWRAQCLSVLCRTHIHTHTNAQIHIFGILSTIIAGSYASCLDVVPPAAVVEQRIAEWGGGLSAETIRAVWDGKASELASTIQTTLTTLAALFTPSLHWRYKCAVLGSIHSLLERTTTGQLTTQVHETVLRVYAEGVRCEHSQVRELAAACLSAFVFSLPSLRAHTLSTTHHLALPTHKGWLTGGGCEGKEEREQDSQAVQDIDWDGCGVNCALLRDLLPLLCNDLSFDGAERRAHHQRTPFQSQLGRMMGAIAGRFPQRTLTTRHPSSTRQSALPLPWVALFEGVCIVAGPATASLLEHIGELAKRSTETGAQVTAACAVSSLAFASAFWSDRAEANAVREKAIDVMVQATMGAIPDCVGHWLRALQLSLHDCAPSDALPPSLAPVLSGAAFEGLTASVKGKALQVAQCLLQAHSWRVPLPLVSFLCDFLQTHIADPLKQVREEVGFTIASLLLCSWAPPPSPSYSSSAPRALPDLGLRCDPSPPVVALVRALFSAAAAEADNEESEKQRLWARETCLHALRPVLSKGAGLALAWALTEHLPTVYNMQDDTDPHLPATARRCLSLVAQSPAAGHAAVLCVAEHSSWRVRASMFPVLQLKSFLSLHNHSVETRRQCLDAALRALHDPQLEVRQLASLSLAGMFQMYAEGIDFGGKAAEFTKTAAHKLPKNRSSEKFPAALVQKHGGVLGLESLVLSQPYSVPAWLPECFVALGNHVGAPNPIGEGVRKTVGEFWRTHQDEWQSAHKHKFNEDQLEAISELISSPSYYA